MSTKQRVILTGGLGFIGSHTAVELSKKGFETIIIDNLDNSDAKVLDAVRELCDQEVYFEETDLKDKSATEMIFEKYEYGFFHKVITMHPLFYKTRSI